MFLRVVRAAGGKGVKHEYVRVVEAVRQNGKTRHRTVLNLGRKDVLAAHLDLNKLMRLLHGEAALTAAYAIAMAGVGWPNGATMPSVSPAERHGCGSRWTNSSSGTVRSINYLRAKQRPSTRSLSRCATCSRCRSTWCSMI